MASHLTLWLVLLACLRAAGLSQAQLPWQTSLAAFAFIRLLTAMPITPGGLGITELGLIGILAAGAGHAASAQVTAAVLMYRAVTYCPPSPSAPSPASPGGTHPRSSAPVRAGCPARPNPPAAAITGSSPRRRYPSAPPLRRTARKTRRSSHGSAGWAGPVPKGGWVSEAVLGAL